MPKSADYLNSLEELKLELTPQAAEEKKRCLTALAAARLTSAEQVSRLHESLCFMRAWPDDRELLATVNEMLEGFRQRPDLLRHADDLFNSGIVGTAIYFRFFAVTARWLAERWPGELSIDWDDFDNVEVLAGYLSLLVSYSETPALDAVDMELPEWIDRLKGPDTTDATFVIRRLAALFPNEFLHEQVCDEIDLPVRLSPGDGVPNRTEALYDQSPVAFQTKAFDRSRPNVAEEVRRPLGRPRLLSRADGSRLVDLARGAMVTRQRDLDAFAYADPGDVSLVDDDGLQFVLYGVVPQRRFLLETLYGFLVLKNGVPISYGAVTCLCNSAEVAYTIFDTFRGGESSRLFVRAVAMVHQTFGCDTCMIDPYQLGADNLDALKSGAWWFYQKLGFRPRDKKLLKLMNQELAAMKRKPRHRSTLAVLKQLASENIYLDLDRQRDDVVGELDLSAVGLAITDLLASRFGAEREHGLEVLSAEATQRLGVDNFRGWTSGEKLAWQRWSPLVALVTDLDAWPDADREALVDLIRNKGGRQELDYLRGFDNHPRLRAAVVEMAR